MPGLDCIKESAVVIPNASHLVYSALKKEIVHGLEPGSPLPLRAVSERFQVSTTPVRDALEILIKDGLCTHRPRYGTIVAPMSVNDLCNIRDIRAGLETEAIRLAVRSISDERIETFDQQWSVTEDDWLKNGIPSLESYLSATLSLRMDTYLQSGNTKLVDLISHYALLAERYLRIAITNTMELHSDIRRHQAFVAAIVDRDCDAAADAVRDLLDWTVSRTTAVLSK